MSDGALVAGRYRIEKELGRGGMAVAYAATDTVRGTSVALKRLLPKATKGPWPQLFEREFHTLKQLSHPRVVQVHDFAYEESGAAFYTMEWLGGGDLNELSPLPFERVCALLSDVASALSLLHSRHMLHRDVTGRNVRVGEDDHAKLIDFGAVVPFGTAPRLVGTPPFCAPELVNGQELDGRVDLYALGATAYLALTGRHAYPARTFDRLREVWRSTPRPPSSFVPEIPKALDELVMSLLSLDRMARPGTAAEVMERLCAIGGLETSEQAVVQQAYLSSPRLVGRDAQVTELRSLILRALRTRGGALLVQGEGGAGRSRFAATCVLESKLLGAVVARTDASEGTTPFGVARALASEVRQALPDMADALDGAVGGELADGGGSTDGEGAPGAPHPDGAGTARALQRFFTHVAQHRALVLVVDDADRIDERSAALLGLLADSTRNHRLLVVATAEPGAGDGGPLAFFASAARVLKLRPFSEADTKALLVSVFGDVPHLSLLASRLHAIAGGLPGPLMALCRHLLERGIVKYEAGAWTLPAELDAGDLPASIQDALASKVAGLTPGALSLARGLALLGRPTELDDLMRLVADGARTQALSALDELVAHGVAHVAGAGYRLASPSYGPLLVASLAGDEAVVLHSRLAELYRSRSSVSWFVARHLHLAGRHDDAIAAILERAGMDVDMKVSTEWARELPPDWEAHMRALIDHAERTGRSARDRHELQSHLLGMAVLRGEASRSDVDTMIKRLELACGRDIYDTLDPDLPEAERLQQTFAQATARYEALSERERIKPPLEALPDLARAALRAIGVLGARYEHAYFAQLTCLVPFQQLSPALQVIQWNVEATTALARGRYHVGLELTERILERMAEPDAAGMHPVPHRYMGLALKYSKAVLCASYGRPLDAAHLSDLAADPVFAINACRIRMVAALARGDVDEAEQHRRAAELLRLQDNPPQMFEGAFTVREAGLYAFAGDLARLKHVLPALQRGAAERPGWVPVVHQIMGSYHRIRGALPEALREVEAGLALVHADDHAHFCYLAAARAELLVELGRAGDALPLCMADLQAARDADFGPGMTPLVEAAALVHSALDQHEQARGLADESIAMLTDFEAGGVVLGEAHEVRARVALAEGDVEAFEAHARRCAEVYRAGHNPLLTARYAALMSLAESRRVQVSDELADAAASSVARTISEMSITQIDDPGERARIALQTLVKSSGGHGGYLYTIKPTGPELMAQEGAASPPQDMDQLVTQLLEVETADSMDETQTCAADQGAERTDYMNDWAALDADSYRPLLLTHEDERGVYVTGVAVIQRGREWSVPPIQLIGAISLALHQSGDVATMMAGQ